MTVEKVKAALPAETTFLGFAGSPWTVATYMVAGQGSREQAEARRYAYRDPEAFAAIIDAVADMTVDYLSGQVRAGVRSEEHTSELQSLMRISYAVFCLKKKTL